MITMSVTDFARNLSRALDRLEFAGEEIALVRNKQVVAKLIPGAPVVTALEAFGDLYGILSDAEGGAWLEDCRGADQALAAEVADPWES